jgi:hypothetical protein
MATPRERIQLALAHKDPDILPIDFGSTSVTGIHVSSVYKLRQGLGLDKPGTAIKVIEPYQMLGEIKPDLMQVLGVDTVSLSGSKNFFGFANENWKEWRTFDGTPVLVPEGFNTQPEPNGDILMYPEGDQSASPGAKMPHGGWYFDNIIRQPPIKEETLNVEDNLEEFGLISDEEILYIKQQADRLYKETNLAIVASFSGTDFGDIAEVPGPSLKNPKGIRDIEEWYMSNLTRPKYIYEVFERQCEIAIANLTRLYQAIGDCVSVAFVVGNDFGTQNGLIISLKTYRGLYKPFHKIINGWIHEHTPWKTLIHSCGGIRPLINDFIEAGFDILNPLQFSAAGMDPLEIKREFGDQITYWGGGVDTQHTLPFGTPEEIRREIRERIQILSPGGGYVFSTIHNIQPLIPVENLVALVETINEFRE